MTIKWRVILLCMIGFSSAYPVCCYMVFDGPNGESILIFGDYHNELFVPNVKAVTDEFGMVKLLKPVPLFLELGGCRKTTFSLT